ncbi:hypothetical protein E8E14_009432 [Neopestalotiopsis sp. 37M]|nr:hypothetical protein E8E14_009432 [Neopestalotiopsis sp. 37M]
MAFLSEFRYFPRLPREIQEMVWRYWEGSKPITRHYFFADKSARSYVAVNPSNRVLTNSLTAHQGPAAIRIDAATTETVFHKIRFSGKVKTPLLATPLHDLWDLKSSIWSKKKSNPVCAHVNFARDVFLFQNVVAHNQSPFQFLTVPLTRTTMNLGKMHGSWVERIRHAAYYPPPDRPGYFVTWSAAASFMKALDAMTSLETLYIVKRPQKKTCRHGALSRWKISPDKVTRGHHHDAGFILFSDFVAEHRRLDKLYEPDMLKPPPPSRRPSSARGSISNKLCQCDSVNAGRGAVDVSQYISVKLGPARAAKIKTVEVVDPLYPGV